MAAHRRRRIIVPVRRRLLPAAQTSNKMEDELIDYSTNAQGVQYYTNNMSASPNYNGCWQNAYKYIYEANSIIESLQGNSNITQNVANQLTGYTTDN